MGKNSTGSNKGGKANSQKEIGSATAYFRRALGALEDKGGPLGDLVCGQLAIAIDVAEHKSSPSEANSQSIATRPIFQLVLAQMKGGGQLPTGLTTNLLT